MPSGELILVIGDKNFSSWSMRPWLVLKAFEIPFREINIALRQADKVSAISKHSPAGLVPILKDGAVTIWDSLAIVEYLAEQNPTQTLWPKNSVARAQARALVSEMHSGFSALRVECPMNIHAEMKGDHPSLSVMRDVERIQSLWASARAQFGKSGPFLFGHFTIADAFYAPVVSRFSTYGVELSAEAAAYCSAVQEHPAFKDWRNEAAEELNARKTKQR